MCTSGRPVRAVVLDFFGTVARATAVRRSRRDPGPARLHHPGAPPGDVVERRHRRPRARRAVRAAVTTTGPGSGSGCWRCSTRPTSTPASTRRSSTTSRRAGRPGCSRPTTRCPACSTTSASAAWAWSSAPTGTGTSSPPSPRPASAGRFDTVVSSAWAGARKPHPRIYRYLLEQAALDPDDVLFVGDTWAPDVEGPLRGGHDARLPRARTGTGRTRRRPPETSARPGRAHPRPHRDPAAPRTGLRVPAPSAGPAG